jgi:hypothetical protein
LPYNPSFFLFFLNLRGVSPSRKSLLSDHHLPHTPSPSCFFSFFFRAKPFFSFGGIDFGSGVKIPAGDVIDLLSRFVRNISFDFTI